MYKAKLQSEGASAAALSSLLPAAVGTKYAADLLSLLPSAASLLRSRFIELRAAYCRLPWAQMDLRRRERSRSNEPPWAQ